MNCLLLHSRWGLMTLGKGGLTLLSIAAIIAWLSAPLTPQMTPVPTPAQGIVCFFQYDYTSGMNRICDYDCLGSQHIITIGAAQLCPITINR